MPEQENLKCPWCRAELIHYTVGKWRCPHCTGFFGIKKNGIIYRDYAQPPPPWVYTLLYIVLMLIGVGFAIAIIMAIASN